MLKGRLVSSDDHVMEPPDLWTRRLPRALSERGPRVVPEEAADWWVCDGHKVLSFGPGTQVGVRFEDPDRLRARDRAENVRRGGFDPAARLADMDADGIDVTLLYPSVAIALFHVPDPALLAACARAYNDWLAEFCRAEPRRLKGVALLGADEVPAAVAELERCAGLGLVSALLATRPAGGRCYDAPEFEPLWAAAEDLGLPLALHVGANRPGPGDPFGQAAVRRSQMATYDHWVRLALGDLILGGVLEKHPGLRVGSIEHELGWIPHWLERLDYAYTQKVRREGEHRFRDGALPSDFFQRGCFASFQEDALGIQLRDRIGGENLLWGSDYPHVESTFPRSREILERVLAPCSEAERRAIVCDNAVRLYGLG